MSKLVTGVVGGSVVVDVVVLVDVVLVDVVELVVDVGAAVGRTQGTGGADSAPGFGVPIRAVTGPVGA